MHPHTLPRGMALIEAMVAIVVVGVALAGLLLAVNTVISRSADPVVQRQLQAIAQEMLEEVQLKPYAVAANAAPLGCARGSFNDVSDYDRYATTAQICTVDGVPIAQLAGYSVQVAVGTATLLGVAEAKRIVVTVSRGTQSLSLVGWRTDYAS